MKMSRWALVVGMLLCAACRATGPQIQTEIDSLKACAEMARGGVLRIADTPDRRFLGKVEEATARCRGGQTAVDFRPTPWVDWSRYWGAGDDTSKAPDFVTQLHHLGPNGRGIDGALLDLEYQRIGLIKFNLFDNNDTYQQFVEGRGGVGGPVLKTWAEMRLPADDPLFAAVGGAGEQLCQGDLIRHRTLTGICNDTRNPLMGSTGQRFARNVELATTFPDLGRTELTKNRHGDRLALLQPDPQVISRRLFTRAQSHPELCREGYGLPGYSKDAECDYKKAPFFNVLAAFWIQFMTHDWFSHLEEGHNQAEFMPVGCATEISGNVTRPLTAEEIARLGCRPGDRIDRAYVADASEPATFSHDGKQYLSRAPKTMANTVTAWWDASQIYGYDERSLRRVKRDPGDPAKLLLQPVGSRPGAGEKLGYLPLFDAADPINPDWAGQETAAMADNWSIGLSFYHNLFTREHNVFVDEFRQRAAASPDADSGLRNPARPDAVMRYRDVSADELYEAARLVVSAEIAKIHTIEWTPQLLYDEPLYRGMNANWNGLLGGGDSEVADALYHVIASFHDSTDVVKGTQWYSVFASGPGIFGLGSKKPGWSLKNPDDVNGGTNHFGSPFNFPEEFITVYRLHALVPDLIEYRELADPNPIENKIPVVDTFRGKATEAMRSRGLANWALSLGRQRLGLLGLQNHPQFLQNLKMDRLESETKQIDVAALDLIRDRERGVPRFNEFRRQYGLRQLASFDDFVDSDPALAPAARQQQQELAKTLREVYGQHVCDAGKVITDAQLNTDGSPINDCLGHPNGSLIDNVEDVDTVVGWLAEPVRPHGFAISETQFVVFILNASRRLFSDRFFTSSFRPEFYTQLGVDWVNDNGPFPMTEKGAPNGHPQQPVSPLKRVLLRAMPELAGELQGVVNVFDPWARDRGDYYSLQWKPRRGAEADEAFRQKN